MLVGPRLDVPGGRDPEVGVAVDGDGLVDVDRDAAHRVDDLLEAQQVDQDVVVDVDAQAARDRLLEHVGALVVGVAEDAGVPRRQQPVDRVEHAGRRVAVGREAVGEHLVERAVLRELRVHHVARQAEHHRPPGPGVQDQEHDRVGADALAGDRSVSAEEQDAHVLAAGPRVRLADAARRRGGAVVGARLSPTAVMIVR